VKVFLLGVLFLTVAMTATADSRTQLDELIARAKSLELDTPYVPPPGDPLVHHAAGYAKVMCTAVFVTGLAPDFAAENVGYFTAPYEIRAKLDKPVIDRANQAVHITLPNGLTRTAKYLGSQGCVTLALGENTVHFTPLTVKSQLPDAATEPWPMGDVAKEPLPPEIDAIKLKAAVDAAFEPPESLTAAFVVTWKGRLIAERYGEGVGHTHAPSAKCCDSRAAFDLPQLDEKRTVVVVIKRRLPLLLTCWSDYKAVAAVAIIDASETGDSIANIVVATGHVIDRVPAATCGAPFQADELINQLGIAQ
jgi:hypothetical protein